MNLLNSNQLEDVNGGVSVGGIIGSVVTGIALGATGKKLYTKYFGKEETEE